MLSGDSRLALRQAQITAPQPTKDIRPPRPRDRRAIGAYYQCSSPGQSRARCAGDTVAEVADRTKGVCEAFSAPAHRRRKPISRGSPLSLKHSDYQPSEDSVAHALPLDTISLAFARRGLLYPNHAVFLGPRPR
jgi:hypothetical protein